MAKDDVVEVCLVVNKLLLVLFNFSGCLVSASFIFVESGHLLPKDICERRAGKQRRCSHPQQLGLGTAVYGWQMRMRSNGVLHEVFDMEYRKLMGYSIYFG